MQANADQEHIELLPNTDETIADQNLLKRLHETAGITTIVTGGGNQSPAVVTASNRVPIDPPYGWDSLYRLQLQAGADHRGYIIVSVDPAAITQVTDICRKSGMFLADLNVSASTVQAFFIRGQHEKRWEVPTFLGREFKPAANAGKQGLKRQRSLKLPGFQSGSAGGNAFVGKGWVTLVNGYAIHHLRTPAGPIKVVEVPAINDSNDNDALVTLSGYQTLATLCGLGDVDSAATLQILTAGPTGAIKYAGQILSQEPTGETKRMLDAAPAGDIYVGPSGVDTKTTQRITGIRANVWHESRQSGLVPADGLQQATAVLGYSTADTVARYTNVILAALVREDQLRVFINGHQPPAPEADTPLGHAARELAHSLELHQRAMAAASTANAAWSANGTRMAYASPQDNGAKMAYQLRAQVNNSARDTGGMPSAFLPGHWCKLMSAMFAGDSIDAITTPRSGWARLVWRRIDQPYGLITSPKDFGTRLWIRLTNGSDFDDKVTITLTFDPETKDPYILVLRRPASPFGGLLLRITRAEAATYERRTGIPAMPLREGWQDYRDACIAYAQLPDQIGLGPKLDPIPASNELDDVLAAAVRQAEQVHWTGRVAFLAAAISLSDHTQNAPVKFLDSDLIDNSVVGEHDGQWVYEQYLNAAVELVHQGATWYRPAVTVIEQSILDRYEETYGIRPQLRYHANSNYDAMWKNLQQQAAWAWKQNELLMARRNGPYQWLTLQLPDHVTGPARSAVEKARYAWTQWGKAKADLPRGKDGRRALDDLTTVTAETIRFAVAEAFELATATPDYLPGSFAAAIIQAQATEAAYWQRYDRRGSSKKYDLIQNLPRSEQVAFFQRQPEWDGADPTWFARVWPHEGQTLQPWDEVEVRLHQGHFQLFPDGADADAPPIARLGPEAAGINGLYSEFVGFVPGKPDTDAPPVALFRNSSTELRKLTHQRVKQARSAMELLRVYSPPRQQRRQEILAAIEPEHRAVA